MSKPYVKANRNRNSAANSKPEAGTSVRAGASPRPKEAVVVERKSLPAWTWLIFGVVLGFGLARWTGESAQPVENLPAIQPARPQPQAVEPVAATPAEESDSDRKRYDFYNLLPEQEVTMDKVEEYKSTPRDDESLPEYMLQVGSFKTKAEADQFVAKLKEMGFTSQISSITAETGTEWHRVRIGPFQDRRKLNKAQDQMAKQNIQSLLIRLPK
ncbi:Sporulation related domain-containing protein [Oceanospirillum multiglobuliferum]|uniref:SPOR domain-containing protein n=1 Tax=Oceanospirillum multiglobuliferum TaxID=64969 RepID=A0A1T4S2Y4_9GAMM|nr:SPOR domain-containing protein [Oceanospirillum multiglobuliferum]OPX54490.1 hypothetical protein BTE48_13895 [Oceanospirillum multiglobuliferum]SKA22517.1 Sporulation related domain-containing protein [Oceanospirillum multiglobuliferum]